MSLHPSFLSGFCVWLAELERQVAVILDSREIGVLVRHVVLDPGLRLCGRHDAGSGLSRSGLGGRSRLAVTLVVREGNVRGHKVICRTGVAALVVETAAADAAGQKDAAALLEVPGNKIPLGLPCIHMDEARRRIFPVAILVLVAAVAGHVKRGHIGAGRRRPQFGVGRQVAEERGRIEVSGHTGLDAVGGHIEVRAGCVVLVLVAAALDVARNEDRSALDKLTAHLVRDKVAVDTNRDEIGLVLAAIHSQDEKAALSPVVLLSLKVSGHVTTNGDVVYVCHR